MDIYAFQQAMHPATLRRARTATQKDDISVALLQTGVWCRKIKINSFKRLSIQRQEPAELSPH